MIIIKQANKSAGSQNNCKTVPLIGCGRDGKFSSVIWIVTDSNVMFSSHFVVFLEPEKIEKMEWMVI